MVRQLERPLSSYLSRKARGKPKPSDVSLDPVPSFDGFEFVRTRAQNAFVERKKTGYLAGTMGLRMISVARELRPSRPDLARVVSDTARGATACVVAIVPQGERVRASVCVPAQRFGRALSLFAFFFAFLASTVIDVI